jgi:endonuclease/exonuclease/phosphatase family metal-dependent hydrolase
MRAVAAVILATLAACDLVEGGGGLDAAAIDAVPTDGYPPPLTGVVPPVGSATTLDIACWNIENFPANATTPSLVADVIASLDLDVIVVEEIASVAAWQELLDRLPEHDGVLSTHVYTTTSYQKVGLIYRTATVQVGTPELLFIADTYAFPRPLFRVPVTVGSLTFDAIGVHFKAGGSLDDAERRAAAARVLDQHLRTTMTAGGDREVIILGDYNENLATTAGAEVMAPLLAPDLYRLRTQAEIDAGGVSFVPSGRIIDHIVTTAGLDDDAGAAAAIIPRLDVGIPRYVEQISDHLPVVLSIPQPAP